jgi:hypothetical protein
VLSNSKMQARQTSCLNNLKQITIAGLMYLNDTQKGFPYNTPTDSGYDPTVAPVWTWALTNCGANSQILICPSTRLQQAPTNAYIPGTADLAWAFDNDETPLQAASYGQNGWLMDFITYPPAAEGGNGSGGLTYPHYMFSKLSAVQKSSLTPLFFDQNYFATVPLETDSAANDLYYGSPPDTYARNGVGCCTIERHGGRTANSSIPWQKGQPLPGAINVCFTDGHGELVKLPKLWNYYWHLNWNPSLVTGP